jgi:AraC-like DNA-binding protein
MNSTLELSILLGPDSAGGAVFRIIALEAPGFGSPGVPLDQGEAGAWTFIPISQDVPGNALIFCAGDPGAQEDERRALAAAIQEYAGACFACAGRPYRDIIEIGKSYTEALGLVSRVRSSGVPGVVFAEEYPDAAVDGENAPAYPADELTRLSERIEGGDTGKIIESVDRILTSISDRHLPDFIARCIVYDIYNMVIATAVRKGIDLQSLIGPALAALTGGASLPLPVLAEELRSSCMSLCGRLAQEGSSNRLLKDILDYIRANCFDINFSVERTADAFRISAPHLSRLFKEYKNINITDHVWAIRLERAKELLASTSLGLHEIVVAVGYSDVSSFSRKFKQTVGMTPGSYRSTSPGFPGPRKAGDHKEQP